EPGTARSTEVELRAGTGTRHFRISAVSFTGIEGALSTDLAIDTTSRLVFIADKNTDNVFEAFSVVVGSSAQPAALSGALVANGNVDRTFLSPDGRHVAFTADKETDGVEELFVAATDGSAGLVKVSGTFVAGGALQPFNIAWSPDGTRLAFVADARTDDVFELFVTPADWSKAPLPISGALVSGGDASLDRFAWSPDGNHLAFIADKLTDGVNELFVAPADGSSEPVRVSGTLVAGGQVQEFAWSPDGTKLAMRAS